MGIMPARMHRAVGSRAICKAGIFMERQGVHIAAQQHRAAIRGAFEGRNEARG